MMSSVEAYQYLGSHYLLSLDGTGQFASSAIRGAECGVKTSHGQESYYHQLLGAVLVHPELPTVLPLAPEAITRQDGGDKKRLRTQRHQRAVGATTARISKA